MVVHESHVHHIEAHDSQQWVLIDVDQIGRETEWWLIDLDTGVDSESYRAPIQPIIV